MVPNIAKKFWPLTQTDLRPEANAPVEFLANVTKGNAYISPVDATTLTNIDALTGGDDTKVAIDGYDVNNRYSAVLSSSPDKITLTDIISSGSYSAAASYSSVTFKYYLRTKPALGIDGPICAIMPIKNHSILSFIDGAGYEVTIPAGKLITGQVYYFNVGKVTTCTAGDFLAISFD